MISTTYFSYNPITKIFTTEISNLPSDFRWEFFPNDKGITVISHKTSEKVRFALYKVDTNTDGEIEGYRLKPIKSELKRNPKLEGVTILLIND